jgi:hypothetical protein
VLQVIKARFCQSSVVRVAGNDWNVCRFVMFLFTSARCAGRNALWLVELHSKLFHVRVGCKIACESFSARNRAPVTVSRTRCYINGISAFYPKRSYAAPATNPQVGANAIGAFVEETSLSLFRDAQVIQVSSGHYKIRTVRPGREKN